MNLISFPFGFFQARGEDNAGAGAVGFDGVSERRGVGDLEDGLQHFDDILKRVLVVIQDNDVIELAQLVFRALSDICV